MAIKTVDEYQNEAKPRVFKYLVKQQSDEDRKAGLMLQVRPWNVEVAKYPEWKGVNAMPAEYIERMTALQKHNEQMKANARSYQEAFEADVVSRKERFTENLAKAAKGMTVGEEEIKTQQILNAENKVETFVLSTAEKDDIIDFVLDKCNVKLDKRKTVENLRVEAAELLGISTE